ncbi:MAG: recombination mediator RecR [Fusobacteriaceae bacterium]|jgi:recombination protein RecR|nr:recombination mediator RecR [Fusobacteriaceae bacterium]
MATKALELLIEEFHKLPGIGRKNAVRLAFHVLGLPKDDVARLAETLLKAKETIKKCAVCGDYSEQPLCDICADEGRDGGTICVVEDGRDILSFEKTGTYKGKYHVLNGKLAPLSGMTADKLNIKPLLERIAKEDVREIILGLNPDFDGDVTASYLIKLLKPFGIRITKIASGIPIGGNIEFADSATISRALDSRIDV